MDKEVCTHKGYMLIIFKKVNNWETCNILLPLSYKRINYKELQRNTYYQRTDKNYITFTFLIEYCVINAMLNKDNY